MSERVAITEEMKVQDEWYAQAKAMTLETLPEFLRHLTTDYTHDYGTICHAIAASAVAAAWAAEKSPQGGITGFQASAVEWCFIEHWGGIEMHPELGARFLNYGDLLFPQYESKFTSISRATMDRLQEVAKSKLGVNGDTVHPAVLAHWKSLADGKAPFGLRVVEKD